MISVSLASQVIVQRGKNFNIANFFTYYKCDKCQTLHNDATYPAISIYFTFNDLAYISRSQKC